MKIRSLILVAALLLPLGGSMLPAWAAPNVSDLKVYQTPCDEFVCDNGDERVQDGDVVTERIQIHIEASSGLGLQWVELQARKGSSNWFCMRRWNTSAPALTQFYNWDTRAIPEGASSGASPTGCESDSDAPWGDGPGTDTYDLRVRARDASGTTTSSAFGVELSNRPSTPTWSSSPRVIGNKTSNAKVELRWNGLNDPDVVEYRVVRSGPGPEKEWGFDASRPGRQGCSASTSPYICYDDSFPKDDYGGTYTYSVVAYRRTGASTSERHVSSCQVTSGNCIASQMSESRSASLQDPPEPSPETTPTPSSPTNGGGSTVTSPSDGGGRDDGPTRAERRAERRRARVLAEQRRQDYQDFFTGEFDETLDYGQREGIGPTGPVFGGVNPGGENDDIAFGRYIPVPRDPTPYKAVAGGMLMLLVAAHTARVLRRSSV